MQPAAYLVYYTMLPVQVSDGRLLDPPFHGPLRDENGRLVRLPLSVNFKGLGLQPGRYRLVPVDSEDHEAGEPIEVVIPPSLMHLDPSVLTIEVFKRAAERIFRAHDLNAYAENTLSSDVMSLARIQAMRMGQNSNMLEAIRAAQRDEDREAALARMVDQLEAMFVSILEHRGRGPSDRPMPLTMAAVRELEAEPLRCTLESIHAAIDRADYPDATVRAIARLALGVGLPATELIDLLPGVTDLFVMLGLVALADGDRAEAALQTLRKHAAPASVADNSARAYILFAAWRTGDCTALRDQILPLARRIARSELSNDARALMCALSDEMGDEGLRSIIEHKKRVHDTLIRDALHVVGAVIEGASPTMLILKLPPGQAEQVGPQFLSRNALCPCGSNKKVKRCCGSDGRAIEAPRTRVRQEARVGPGIATNPGTGSALSNEPDRLPALVASHASAHRWNQAIACADHASKLDAVTIADACHAAIVEHALRACLPDLAAAHYERIEDRTRIPVAARVALAIGLREAGALELLGDHIRDLLEPEAAELFALALLGTVPVLGLFVARSCLGTDAERDDRMVEAIEQLRDRAGLPPFDPAWQLRDRLRPGQAEAEAERLKRESSQLRDDLVAVETRLRGETQRSSSKDEQIDGLLRQLGRLTATSTIEPEERRILRERIDDLKATIRDGNEERAELRRALASRDLAPPSRTNVCSVEPLDDADGESVPARARRALVPRVDRMVSDAMQTVPQHVAAEAMRTLGELAAGDAAAWQGVKQVKGTSTPIYSARIGIHHRLIFRIDEQNLDTIDLVSREDLSTTLKRVRTVG